MKSRLLIGLALVVAPLAAASAMPVSTFLDRVQALKSKGAFAIFSGGEIRRLTRQIEADGAELRAENKAAEAAGRRKAYCAPPGGVKMDQAKVFEAMDEVPPAERARMSTKDAIRAYLAKRHPCQAS